MSTLSDLAPAFQRTLAPPGRWAELFPEATEDDVIGYVVDGLAEAQMDGFLREYVPDLDADEVTPDLSSGEAMNAAGALVMVYAHYRMLTVEVKNRKNHVRYQAGPTTFEEDVTASMLNELMRQAKARKDALLERAERGELAAETFVLDANFIRASSDYSGVGFAPYALDAWGR